MDLTQNNYLWGEGNGDTWYVHIGSATRQPRSYFEEIKEISEYVYANKEGKIYLMYSGGMDSEYVFNVFLHLGFKFTPVLIRLNNDYNEHDLKYAFDFCTSKGVKPLVIDFDFDEFVHSGRINELAETFRCGAFQIPATMEVASKLDGFIVLGNDPPYMKIDKERQVWRLEELEVIHSILNYFRMFNLKGCPFLLSYTPESMLSFLLDPTIVDLANHRIPGKEGTNSTKVMVYNNGTGFNMKPRKKYTGYEIVERSKIFQHPNLQMFQEYSKKWAGAHYEDYDKIVNRLRSRP